MVYKHLAKYVFYPLLQLKSSNFGHMIKLREIKQIYGLPLEQIEKVRQRKLRSLLRHAYNNCEYYRAMFEELGIDVSNITFEHLRSLPVLTKSAIRGNVNRIIASNLKSVVKKDSTGGSTTEPMIFYRDPNCWDLRNAYQIYFNQLLGWDIGTKWALIWGASKDLSNDRSLKSLVREKFVLRRIMLNAVHMSPSVLHTFTEEFVKFKPEVVYGYPSAIYQYCKYLENTRNRVDFVKTVICTAEPLNKDQARYISEVFMCDVFNRYTTRECGILAQECRAHNGLHVNYLSLDIQIRDHSILVTDLDNYGMPLINYEIGDMTTNTMLMRVKCKCGFPGPLIRLGASRDTDFFILKDGTLVFGAGIPIVALTGECGIKSIQIVQKDYDYFIVNIVKDKGFGKENLERIEKTLKGYLGKDIKLQFNYLQFIERNKRSGKYKYVISELTSVHQRLANGK